MEKENIGREKEEYSKNEHAQKTCGLRMSGNPLFLPGELGYECPVCGSSDEVNLCWSEYNCFLWCRKCNKDYPSLLCLKYHDESGRSKDALSTEERVEKATEIFLECIDKSLNREATKRFSRALEVEIESWASEKRRHSV